MAEPRQFKARQGSPPNTSNVLEGPMHCAQGSSIGRTLRIEWKAAHPMTSLTGDNNVMYAWAIEKTSSMAHILIFNYGQPESKGRSEVGEQPDLMSSQQMILPRLWRNNSYIYTIAERLWPSKKQAQLRPLQNQRP